MKKKILTTLLPVKKGKWNWLKYLIYGSTVVIYLLKQFDILPDDLSQNLIEFITKFGQ